MEKEISLGAKTHVPIGWIFALFGCSGTAVAIAITAGLYAGRIETRAAAAESVVNEIKTSAANRDSVLRIIDERLSRIEGALGVRMGQSLMPHRNRGASERFRGPLSKRGDKNEIQDNELSSLVSYIDSVRRIPGHYRPNPD